MSQCYLSKNPYSSIRSSKAQLSSITLVLLGVLFTFSSAQAASCKIPKSYYKNVSCTSSRGYFLASKDFGAPVALINSKGKPVVNLSSYQKVAKDRIAGGLIPVQRNNRVGYINMQGREVIPTVYNTLSESGGWARAVSEGRIIVKRDGKYGVISTSNQTIVPFSSSFSDIDNYRSGVAKVRKNQASSWLDKNGNATDDPNAPVATSSAKVATDNPSAQAQAAPPQREPTAPEPVIFTTLEPDQQDGKWGFVDEKNTIMITYSFDEVRPFSEGLAGVRIDNDWGFLNLGGELVIPFHFKNSSETQSDDSTAMFIFKEGKAWTSNLRNGDKVCIGKEGNIVDCD